MAKPAKPTPTQREALTKAIESTGRLIHVGGDCWTTDDCPRKPYVNQWGHTKMTPEWSVTRVTIRAMEAKGWLVKEGEHRDSPRRVTDAGRAALVEK